MDIYRRDGENNGDSADPIDSRAETELPPVRLGTREAIALANGELIAARMAPPSAALIRLTEEMNKRAEIDPFAGITPKPSSVSEDEAPPTERDITPPADDEMFSSGHLEALSSREGFIPGSDMPESGEFSGEPTYPNVFSQFDVPPPNSEDGRTTPTEPVPPNYLEIMEKVDKGTS